MRKLFVISAPSGTGKTTIAEKLKQKIKDIYVPVTYTTRKPRTEEIDARDYHFVSVESFRKMMKNGRLLEWAQVYGNYYGTPRDEVLENLKNNKKVLLTIDTQGGLKIKKIFPDAVLIGLLPPSIAEQENRIRKRRGLSESEIKKRIEAARKERKVLMSEYDFRFVNKNLETTIQKIVRLIEKGTKLRCTTKTGQC